MPQRKLTLDGVLRRGTMIQTAHPKARPAWDYMDGFNQGGRGFQVRQPSLLNSKSVYSRERPHGLGSNKTSITKSSSSAKIVERRSGNHLNFSGRVARTGDRNGCA